MIPFNKEDIWITKFTNDLWLYDKDALQFDGNEDEYKCTKKSTRQNVK